MKKKMILPPNLYSYISFFYYFCFGFLESQ
jgi:hypothetical protein